MKPTRQVSSRCSEVNRKKIDMILNRFEIITGQKINDRLSLEMDITACNANGCPLDFDSWLVSKDFDFVHDVVGIREHIDRETGTLPDYFRPRFALKNAK